MAVLVALAVPLAACGGGDGGGDDVATLSGDTSRDGGDGASGDDEVTDEEREDAMLEFAQCMRDHGVDMPDPTFEGGDGGGRIEIGVSGGPDVNREEMEAADEACRDLLEDVMGEAPQLSPEEEAEMRDNMLAFAECMREHGIDMPDPDFDGKGGVMIGPGPNAEGGPDFDDEDFQEAQEACQGELGFDDGEGPGGGPVMRFDSGSASTKASS